MHTKIKDHPAHKNQATRSKTNHLQLGSNKKVIKEKIRQDKRDSHQRVCDFQKIISLEVGNVLGINRFHIVLFGSDS